MIRLFGIKILDDADIVQNCSEYWEKMPSKKYE